MRLHFRRHFELRNICIFITLVQSRLPDDATQSGWQHEEIWIRLGNIMQVGRELFPNLVLSRWAGDLLKPSVILFEFYQISFNVSAESLAKKVPESRVTSIERPFCFYHGRQGEKLFTEASRLPSWTVENISDTLACGQCATSSFLPHSDVICDLLLNKRTGSMESI